ncbi:mandelate racemase/muconate lactonizing enzyme family protein [Brevibacterium sp. SMBL_HHYL_HB1]|jgi:galactonate dehydratase|uniref:mandelate racemase/muconate lactonizing enzyme family protein n=1 Tax=Brevibacterium sp. SMBL_HHYL_HB1 TaxID=2777556 RepID=UPI001BAA52A6|nr:mandelate racemase/muconate lactonizing enzyme family protein [Brevibacterium sp. SMBL_HHYL_HB1]QUL78042.1 mandelate racemase/muconate lactonizing enzyme family protein [Brevibacterium sp. SMBL_HHYL_HB1]
MATTIASLETLSCDAGWRNYHFLKLTTSDGVVGWSEFDEDFGPRGLTAAIEAYAPFFIGADVMNHERSILAVGSTMRPAPHGITGEVLGAVENAMLDAKARTLNVPVYELLGGKHRDSVPIYWSHCASWRISHPSHYGNAITDLNGVKDIGHEARERGFQAVKTNIFQYGENGPKSWGSGFGNPYEPGLNITPALIRDVTNHLSALREGAGDDVEILIDFNFNARTEGYVKLLRALSDFDLLWAELDIYNPEALAFIRAQSHVPIASCETAFGVRQFLPYLSAQAIDVGIVDVVWNGVAQGMKIAHTAEAFDVNVAPHNFYSHLATTMSAHFAMAVPNLRIMEHDVDRLDYDDELFTAHPEISAGRLSVPDGPGWGIEPIEDEIRRRPAVARDTYLGIKP